MAEYIEREKAIAICQNYYEHCLETHDYCGDSVAYDIRTDIQGLPTADVVSVVRCKDCVYCVDLGTSGLYCDHDDNRNPLGCRPNDYCNDGERRVSNE